MPNKITYTITKYLTFITPPLFLFVCAYFIFHNIIQAVISTMVLLLILIGILALYVSKHTEYTEQIQRTERNAKYKVAKIEDRIIKGLNKKK